MKYLIIAVFLLAQAPASEPYPGQSQHAEPPSGWYCEHQNFELSVPPAHACSCEAMCDENGTRHEDQQCTVWCHADHCHCDMSNRQGCKSH